MADADLDLPRTRYGVIGSIGSGLYVVLVVGLVWWGGKPLPWLEDSNEFGDFLAGFAAPLAFFWLVLGFFQQGEELRLQAKELRAAVKQAAAQASALSVTAEHTRHQAIAILNERFESRLADSVELLLKCLFKRNRVVLGKTDFTFPIRDLREAREKFNARDYDAFFEELWRITSNLDNRNLFVEYFARHPNPDEVHATVSGVLEEFEEWQEALERVGGSSSDMGRGYMREREEFGKFRNRMVAATPH